MSQASLAVVTVTYSPGPYLRTFLESIPAATQLPVHVVMADNGSTDGAPEAAVRDYASSTTSASPAAPVLTGTVSAAADTGNTRAASAISVPTPASSADSVAAPTTSGTASPRLKVELLRTGGNIGYGAAINCAVAHLRAHPQGIAPDYILISNPDVEFSPGAIDELLAAAARWEKAGSLGPLIREADGGVYPSARSIPRIGNGIAHALLAPIWPGNPWTKSYLDDRDMSSERPAGWLSGSCLLVRWAAFDAIGGFDDSYFMYMEDVDFGDRLGKAGWQNIFVPTAEIRHAKGHAASSHPETMLPAHHRSAYKFQADRHPYWWQAPLRWILKAGLWVRCQIALAAARRKRS